MNMQELIAEHIGLRSVRELHEAVVDELPADQTVRYETVRQWCNDDGRQPGRPAEAIALARALGIGELDVFEVMGWKPSGPDIRQRVEHIEHVLRTGGGWTEPVTETELLEGLADVIEGSDAVEDVAQPKAQ